LPKRDCPQAFFNVVPAGRETGDYLVRHPGIDKVSFTGSTAAGRNIMAACAGRMARCSFELGGKSAAIVLDDADIGNVLQSLVPFSMPITGQVCFSLTRVLVPRSRANEVRDAYVAAVSNVKVGDPFDAGTQMGPLTMSRQLTRVQGYIEKGRSEGARLVLGGGRPATSQERLLHRTHGIRRCRYSHDDRAGGDLRTRRLVHQLRRH
jgi:aldehyde dehydrogenase (NAD+)